MKKIVLLPIAFLILFSCEKKDQIEIIPDYESLYIPEKYLDVEPELVGDDQKVLDAILDIFANNTADFNKDVYYFFYIDLFINQKGKIEKIQFKEDKFEIEKKSADQKFAEAELNPDLSNIYRHLQDYFQTLQLDPGIKDGQPVNSSSALEVSVRVDKEKRAEYYLDYDFSGFFLPKIDKGSYLVAAEEMPVPEGGIAAIQKNIHYPEIAKRAGIEGRVFIKAFINEEGIVVSTEVIKGIGSGCDEAAQTAVEKTKFIPGKQRGKPIKVQVAIPILFKLK